MAITNAYILHSYDVTTTVLDHKSLRMMLAKQLIGDRQTCKRSRPTPHLPSHSKRRPCVYCKDFRSPRRKESCGSTQPVSVIHNCALPVAMMEVTAFAYGTNYNHVIVYPRYCTCICWFSVSLQSRFLKESTLASSHTLNTYTGNIPSYMQCIL